MANKVIAKYKNVKYSLQPHGLRSKLLYYFAAFVVSFGGALLVASPADGAPGDMTCYVETTPSADPSPDPSATPTPAFSQTPCPTPPPAVITTITVVGPVVTTTKAETKTVFVTEQVVVTPSPSPSLEPTIPTTPEPSLTPSPITVAARSGPSSLVKWGIGTTIATGLALVIFGVVGIVRGRRKEGKHRVDDRPTQLIPAVPAGVNDHDLSDYKSDLGGRAGDSFWQRDTNTEELPHDPDPERNYGAPW